MIEKQLHGSVYVALGPGMQVYDISTEGIGEAGFRQFIDSIQHASIRKRGVPILTFGRYDMEDMRGLHFTSGQENPLPARMSGACHTARQRNARADDRYRIALLLLPARHRPALG